MTHGFGAMASGLMLWPLQQQNRVHIRGNLFKLFGDAHVRDARCTCANAFTTRQNRHVSDVTTREAALLMQAFDALVSDPQRVRWKRFNLGSPPQVYYGMCSPPSCQTKSRTDFYCCSMTFWSLQSSMMMRSYNHH